jgi:hypothetical protein
VRVGADKKTVSGSWLLVSVFLLVAAATQLGWGVPDADWGRNTDHEPPTGEETWDPDLEDPLLEEPDTGSDPDGPNS